MSTALPGLHHVTAIAGDPQRNIDFYTGVLGLRLVKITINYDDPGAYHFYYGDEVGSPGSVLTFFSWPGAYRGRIGTGQATVTSFSVPEGSLDWWQRRFAQYGVRTGPIVPRWDEQSLGFFDPDGLQLELVAHPGAALREAWPQGPIAPEYATRGFHSVTLALRDEGRTADLLTGTMGFQKLAQEGDRARYAADVEGTARLVDIVVQPNTGHGTVGLGCVHHIAWRTPTDAQQEAWRSELTQRGFHVSPIMDRQYFRSIYFREPGGVLFEIATDTPGFTADEPKEALGSRLRLPEWLEPSRVEIERILPPVTLPTPTLEVTA